MSKTEAQIRANRAYRERRGGLAAVQKTIGATVSPAEAERIKTAFVSVGMSNADVLKRAATRIEQGDDLRRDYNAETNMLIEIGNAETQVRYIDAMLKNYNISQSELLNRAVERLAQGDDLAGRYDAESGRIIPIKYSDEQ